MANVERLTKRVKDLEEWTKENEMTGGPQGVLDTFIFLLNSTKHAQDQSNGAGQQLQQFRGLAFEFIEEQKLGDKWNEFIKEKDEKSKVPEEEPESEDTEGEETSKQETKE
jgi:hypothetical protein